MKPAEHRVAMALLLTLAWNGFAAEGGKTMAETEHQRLPRLSVDQEKHGDRTFTMVRIAVPTIPDFECDVWCYEDRLGQGEGLPQDDGSLILKHSTKGQDGPIHVTTRFVPHVGEVDFIVKVKGQSKRDVRSVRSVNACWQLRRAPGFGHEGDFVKTFVNQCFIYTAKGFTLLGDTKRFPDTRRPPDHRTNSPPWVQVYVPTWRRHPGQPKAFWGNSTDRPVYPIIGEVSRDGKWLAALAWPNCGNLCQGWHDCLHNGPTLLEGYDEETNQTVYRGKFYFMENDPKELLERYRHDLAPARAGLSIELRRSGKRALVIKSDDLPSHHIELHVPAVVAATNPPSGRWRKEWWDTWYRQGTTVCPFAAWVRAHRDHVNVYVTCHNDKDRPIDAGVGAFIKLHGWQTGSGPYATSEDSQWVAAYAWEGAELATTAPHARMLGNLVVRLAPGEVKTIRGRLYCLSATPERLARLRELHQGEWQRAVPFRLAIPSDAE